jgi:plastocyanin
LLQHGADPRNHGRPSRWLTAAALTFVCALVGTTGLHSAPEPPGSIEGHVSLTTRMRGVPIGTNAYAPRRITHQAPPTVPEMRSVVVYLKDVPFTAALPATRTQIKQTEESFSPRVAAVTKGSTVDFPNFDPYFHNVFSLSGAGTFDLGRYPEGQSRSRQFTRPGLVKVYCHIHSQMSATILVLDHPYFAIPDEGGQFTIPQVPAGEYTLVGWHERVGEQTSRITVTSARSTRVSVSLPVGDTR